MVSSSTTTTGSFLVMEPSVSEKIDKTEKRYAFFQCWRSRTRAATEPDPLLTPEKGQPAPSSCPFIHDGADYTIQGDVPGQLSDPCREQQVCGGDQVPDLRGETLEQLPPRTPKLGRVGTTTVNQTPGGTPVTTSLGPTPSFPSTRAPAVDPEEYAAFLEFQKFQNMRRAKMGTRRSEAAFTSPEKTIRRAALEQCLLAEGSGLAAPGQKGDGSSGTMGMSKKQKKRMQHELHVMDTVAEVFNPERFSKRAARFRLKTGRAFDLALGHDLLKLSNQQSILDYINHERPGLVIVSPPCNAFSSLNNLLMKFRQRNLGALKKYIKALDIGKKLLNFAMKVCELCHSLQISFVFEHPQTARSWQERSVRRLIARPGIHRVVAHQCQFGLRSKDQRLHKKPTAS